MKTITKYYLIAVLLSLILTIIDYILTEEPTKIGGISIFMFNYIVLTIMYSLIGLYYKYIKK